MWLRDQLPVEFPQLRSILYGYDTRLLMSESFQTVDHLALSMIARLESIGLARPSAKPVLFLAHSLGGIVLKRALVEMANSGPKQKFMFGNVGGVVAFGVPGLGMETSHLLSMIDGQPNEALVAILSPDSSYLPQLDESFGGISQYSKIRLISVYETVRTRIPEVRNNPRRLLM